jgi:hypothetical protein
MILTYSDIIAQVAQQSRTRLHWVRLATMSVFQRNDYTIGLEIEGLLWLGSFVPNQMPDWRRCFEILAYNFQRAGEDAVCNPKPKSGAAQYYKTHWAITRDASLEEAVGEVGYEAVSPIYHFYDNKWRQALVNFAIAFENSPFYLRDSRHAATHVHVARSNQPFTLHEMKTICFATIVYEAHIFKMLPPHRQQSKYCRGVNNGGGHIITRQFRGGFDPKAVHCVWELQDILLRIRNLESLVEFVQGAERHMLWNFMNTIHTPGKVPTGTIEFRGGHQATSAWVGRRYVSLAVAFIQLALKEVRHPTCTNRGLLPFTRSS